MKRNARHIRTGVTVILGCAAVLGTLVLPTVPPAAGAVDATPADMVIEWNANAQAAIIGTAGQGPTVAYLHLAMVQGAVYDAVNAIEGGYEPYLEAPAMADPEDSSPAAVAKAAHDVLVGAVPEPAARPSTRSSRPRSRRSPTAPRRRAGSRWGRRPRPRCSPRGPATDASLRSRSSKASTPASGGARHPRSSSSPPRGSGTSGRSSSTTRPRCARTDRTRSALTTTQRTSTRSRSWGRSRARRAPRTRPTRRCSGRRTAPGCSTPSSGSSPTRRTWTSPRRRACSPWRTSPGRTARSRVGTTSTTGTSGGRSRRSDEADNDGNPATVADPNWTPLFATPPFPEHPSGHTCISGAVVETLQQFFGTDKVSFSTFSSFSNSTRSFDRFSEAIREIIDARVWAGIHFRTADAQGHVIGRKVAHELKKNYFEPVS